MSERKKSVDQHEIGARRRYGVDDHGVPVWSDEDENMVSGRNWSVILIFMFVPLMALVVLALCLFALFAHVFSPVQAVETMIESTEQRS